MVGVVAAPTSDVRNLRCSPLRGAAERWTRARAHPFATLTDVRVLAAARLATRPRHCQGRNESRPSVRYAHGCAPASPLRGSTRTAAPRRPRQSQTNLPIECRIGRRCAARCRRESFCPEHDPHAPASASQLVLLSRRISGARFESSSSVALCCTTVTASKRHSLWHSRRPRGCEREKRCSVHS